MRLDFKSNADRNLILFKTDRSIDIDSESKTEMNYRSDVAPNDVSANDQSTKNGSNQSKIHMSTVANQNASSLKECTLSNLISMAIDEYSESVVFSAHELLERYPELDSDPVAAAEIAFEEFTRRVERQEDVNITQFLAGFPRCASELKTMLDCYDFLVSKAAHLQPELIHWPKIGDQVGEFIIRDRLGRGAFSTVYLAEQTQVDSRPVALKMTSNLRHEVQNLAPFTHPNVVPIYNVVHFRDLHLSGICMPFFGRSTLFDLTRWIEKNSQNGNASLPVSEQEVLEYVYEKELEANQNVGFTDAQIPTSLRKLVQTDRKYIEFVDDVGRQILSALAIIHQQSIQHCDIKPSNVLIDPAGQARLIDFNLATNDQSKTPGGTLPYMAPEQIRAVLHRDARAESITPSTDLYGWGIVMWQLMTGKLPFGDCRSVDRSSDIRNNELLENQIALREQGPGSLKELAPNAPAALCEAIEWALRPQTKDRPQSVAQLLEILDKSQSASEAASVDKATDTDSSDQSSGQAESKRTLPVVEIAVATMALLLLVVASVLFFNGTFSDKDNSNLANLANDDSDDEPNNDGLINGIKVPDYPSDQLPIRAQLDQLRSTTMQLIDDAEYLVALHYFGLHDKPLLRSQYTPEDWALVFYLDGLIRHRGKKWDMDGDYYLGLVNAAFEAHLPALIEEFGGHSSIECQEMVLNMLGHRAWNIEIYPIPVDPMTYLQIGLTEDQQPENFHHVMMVTNASRSIWAFDESPHNLLKGEFDPLMNAYLLEAKQHMDAVARQVRPLRDQEVDSALVEIILAVLLIDEESRAPYEEKLAGLQDKSIEFPAALPTFARERATELIEGLSFTSKRSEKLDRLKRLCEVWATLSRSDSNMLVPPENVANRINASLIKSDFEIRDYLAPYEQDSN